MKGEKVVFWNQWRFRGGCATTALPVQSRHRVNSAGEVRDVRRAGEAGGTAGGASSCSAGSDTRLANLHAFEKVSPPLQSRIALMNAPASSPHAERMKEPMAAKAAVTVATAMSSYTAVRGSALTHAMQRCQAFARRTIATVASSRNAVTARQLVASRDLRNVSSSSSLDLKMGISLGILCTVCVCAD
jgi:hypothetical protein